MMSWVWPALVRAEKLMLIGRNLERERKRDVLCQLAASVQNIDISNALFVYSCSSLIKSVSSLCDFMISLFLVKFPQTISVSAAIAS